MREEVSQAARRSARRELRIGFEEPCIGLSGQSPGAIGHNTGDLRLALTETNQTAGEAGIGAEVSCPCFVAEDDGGNIAIFFRSSGGEPDLQAEQSKEIEARVGHCPMSEVRGRD